MKTIVKGLVCAVGSAILSCLVILMSGCAGLVSGANNTSSTPQALAVANVQAAAITTSSSQVSWTTDAPADSSVDYGTTPAYGNTTPANTAMVTSHQITLTGLAAGVTYYYQVNSTDSKGNHGHGKSTFKTTGLGISGSISPATAGSGTTLTLSGAQSATTTVDSTGAYAFSGLSSGSYGVTPSGPGYSFSPASQNINVSTANVTAVNFSASTAAVAPAITTQPTSQTVTTGQTAAFTVAATGTAPLSYQWQKNGVNIAGATSSSYTTPATTTSDSGSTFDVVVSNSVGTKTSSAVTLTVNADTTAPTAPTNVTAAGISPSQISLAWTASTDNVAVTGYNVFRGGAKIATSTSASYVDSGLAPSTSYTYNVSAYDAAGNTSVQSAGASATTQSSSGGGGIPSALGWYQIPNTTLAPVCSTDQNIQ
ncbi:MAG TPA: fibronectin type III domain-containing protein, partial [Candidatus Acidoferrum sp.]|nr:fibronectin type III domain-containing protein [Candidatus Acidoferrum sp.]